MKTYEHWFGEWADLYMLAGLPQPPYFTRFANALVDLMDAVVLGGGDLICPYRSRIDPDFINPAYLRRPVHVAGIGVELNRKDIDSSVVGRWQAFLSDPAVASITNRDPRSKEWIEEHLDVSRPVDVHPDLVCALPLPAVDHPEGGPILGIVTRHVKTAENYAQLPEVARRLAARGWRIRHIIAGVGAHGRRDLENAQLLEIEGKEVVYTEDLDAISRAIGECSLVLSMKLHTTIVSTMYGVPTVSVNPVAKARQFMKAAGASDLVIGPLDPRLLDVVEYGVPAPDPQRVDLLREEASAAIRALGQRVWDDFRADSPERSLLPELPYAAT